MKLISLKMPKPSLKLLDELVEAGMYPNRSEAMRQAIRDLLITHDNWSFQKCQDALEKGALMT